MGGDEKTGFEFGVWVVFLSEAQDDNLILLPSTAYSRAEASTLRPVMPGRVQSFGEETCKRLKSSTFAMLMFNALTYAGHLFFNHAMSPEYKA